MKKVSRSMSIWHVLMVSLALNVGLISRLMFEGDIEQTITTTSNSNTHHHHHLHHLHGLYFQQQQQLITRNASMADSSDFKKEEAHISNKTALLPSSSTSSSVVAQPTDGPDTIINLDHGDPTMYEKYWQQRGDKTTVVFSGWQSISYFSNVKSVCWFLEPDFAKAVVRLHNLVGNAVTEGRHIVVGTGSSQLYHAALYALSPPDASTPISVVSAAPFYSSYPLMTDFLKSGLHKWAGDAHKFTKDGPYIELVTSPNNPDGHTREAVVNRPNGILIHDFAYYWPQYTAISSAADHDLMLFTVSKCTGHAGPRIGWAIVKDKEVAKKMAKYVEINTIGVSRDSQVRAAKILNAVSDGHDPDRAGEEEGEPFFDFGHDTMAKRWKQVRAAVNKSRLFSLPEFPRGHCKFSGRHFEHQPAFAWLKCEGAIEDCERFLRGHKILARAGQQFGDSSKYVRISMMERDRVFDLFTERLSNIQSSFSSDNK